MEDFGETVFSRHSKAAAHRAHRACGIVHTTCTSVSQTGCSRSEHLLCKHEGRLESSAPTSQKAGVLMYGCNPSTLEKQRQGHDWGSLAGHQPHSRFSERHHLKGIEQKVKGQDIQHPSPASAHVRVCISACKATMPHARTHITQRENRPINFKRKKNGVKTIHFLCPGLFSGFIQLICI